MGEIVIRYCRRCRETRRHKVVKGWMLCPACGRESRRYDTRRRTWAGDARKAK